MVSEFIIFSSIGIPNVIVLLKHKVNRIEKVMIFPQFVIGPLKNKTRRTTL
jgi:hypothetical protein